jgi:hypothetical protein
MNWLMLFKEIIAVYVENHTKPVIKSTGLLTVETLGIYIVTTWL